MITWGLVMTFMGLVTSAGGLQVARWFLGMAEGGLYPGLNYMIVSVGLRFYLLESTSYSISRLFLQRLPGMLDQK